MSDANGFWHPWEPPNAPPSPDDLTAERRRRRAIAAWVIVAIAIALAIAQVAMHGW
jgi:hypothetical protein